LLEPAATLVSAPQSRRLPHADNLRAALVAWIIGGHALLGYSAIGGWEYDEINEVTFGERVEFVLTAILGPSALLVIGAFFFIAGLFAPRALDRRGPGRFVLDRTLRLALPYLAFALLLWPLIIWLTYRAVGRADSYWWVFTHRDPLLDAGPLWFVAVLFIFSVAYAGWRVLRPAVGSAGGAGRTLRGGHLVALAVGLTLATFVVRLWLPARSNHVGDLHLWQWPQCAALFGFGIAWASSGLPEKVPDRVRRGCGATILTMFGLLPLLAFALGISELEASVEPFLGGWRWQALLTAAIESTLVVVGSVWLLGMAQRRMTQRGRLATAATRAAYAAFVLQGPVLLTIAVAARPVTVPVEVKAFLVAALGIGFSFWLGWLLVSRTRLGRIF